MEGRVGEQEKKTVLKAKDDRQSFLSSEGILGALERERTWRLRPLTDNVYTWEIRGSEPEALR